MSPNAMDCGHIEFTLSEVKNKEVTSRWVPPIRFQVSLEITHQSPIPPPVSIQLNEHTVNAHELLKGHHARGAQGIQLRGSLVVCSLGTMRYPSIYQGTKDSALPPRKALVLSRGSEGRGRVS